MRTGHHNNQNKFNNSNRQPQRNNRNRPGGNKGGNSPNRAYESNGPGIKLRGTAHHIAERYVTLARDAQSSGDTIAYEGYMQHAEHYLRLIAANNEIMKANNPNFRAAPLPGSLPEEFDEDEGDEEGQGQSIEPVVGFSPDGDQPDVTGEPFRREQNHQPRRRFDASGEGQQGEGGYEPRPNRFNRDNRYNRQDNRNQDNRNQENRAPSDTQPQETRQIEPRTHVPGEPRQNDFRRERRPYPPQVNEQPAIEQNFGLPAFLTAPPSPVKPEAVIVPVEAAIPDEAAPPRRRGRPRFEPKTLPLPSDSVE